MVQCWGCRKGNSFFAFRLNDVYYQKSVGQQSTERSLIFIYSVNVQSHEWIILSITSSDIFEETESLVYDLHDKTENGITVEVSVIT